MASRDPERRAIPVGTMAARSISASAMRIDLGDRAQIAGIPRKAADWQRDAWAYYDLVPQVKYAARFLGKALGRIRLYAGLRLQADENPAPLDQVLALNDALRTEGVPEDLLPAPGLTKAMVDEANDQMVRLRNRRTGQGGLLRAWGVCLSIPGDSYLVGMELPEGQPGAGEEEWQVVSPSNVTATGDRVKMKLSPGGKGFELPENATLIRVWQEHEQWPLVADSNMRSVLDVCEELLIYARQFRAIGKSRSNAGLLLLPNELDFANPAAEPDGVTAPPDSLTPFERGLVMSLVTPTADDSAPSSVAPHLIRGPADALEQVRHVPLDRKIDDQAIERIVFLIGNLAQGLDVPPEVLTGMADANHWTAWQIEDSTYKAHVEPLAALPQWAITSEYLRPMLDVPGSPWAGSPLLDLLECGLDPSMLVVRPNRGQDAKDAHQALVISDDALRRYLGFADADAPSADEFLRRYALTRAIGAQGLTREVMRGTLEGADEIIADPKDAAAAEAEGTAEAEPATPAEGDQPIPDTGPARSLVAAAVDSLVAGSTGIDRLALVAAASGNVGARLAAIDSRLRDRLQVAASAAVTDALRKAGSRLRAKRSNDADTAAVLKGLDPTQVGPALAVLGLTAQEIDDALAGAFDDLSAQWDAWVSQAQDDTEAVLRQASNVDGAGLDAAMDEYRASTDEDRHAGWALLAAGLLALARRRTAGLAEVAEPGEADTTVSVQAGDVRSALARAGGSVDPTRPPLQVAGHLEPGSVGGVATGPRSLGTLTRLGLAVVGWEWHTGAPSVPFPPHSALEGLRFTSWDDPALANSAGTFPGFGHYFPGDHRGCQCDAVPVVIDLTVRTPADASA